MGNLVKPEPPVRRFADVVPALIQSMALAGFGGSQKIAETLARAGWKLSKRTVSRVLAEPSIPGDSTPSADTAIPYSRALTADYPNHIFMADLTDIPSLFGLFRLKLALVLDVFSRMPLAFRVFYSEPSAESIARLLKRAIERFGAPKYFVSDRREPAHLESPRRAPSMPRNPAPGSVPSGRPAPSPSSSGSGERSKPLSFFPAFDLSASLLSKLD